MGRVKEDWMDREALESMYDWIEENYGDDAGEVGSKEWRIALQAYEEYCEEIQKSHEDDYSRDEYEYYQTLNSTDAISIFRRDILELRQMLHGMNNISTNKTFLKMVFAHAVTILEVYLEDTTKSLILANDSHLKNTIKKVKPFCDTPVKLGEISLEPDGIKKFVINKISDNLFHNIPKVMNTLSGILDRRLNTSSTQVCFITEIRHDIVHRNGRNKDGEKIEITFPFVSEALESIHAFAISLVQEIETRDTEPF